MCACVCLTELHKVQKSSSFASRMPLQSVSKNVIISWNPEVIEIDGGIGHRVVRSDDEGVMKRRTIHVLEVGKL